MESESLPSIGYYRKSYLQTTSQKLARDKLVHLHGRRSLALPSVGLVVLKAISSSFQLQIVHGSKAWFLHEFELPKGSTYTETNATVFPIGNAFELSFPEARRGRIGPRHDTDHCSTLRHAIQDLIDQGLDDGLPKMIVPNDGYDIVGVTSNFLVPTPFNWILDRVPLQLISSTPSDVGHGDTFAPFILWPEDVDVDVQVMTCNGRITQAATPVTRPFGGMDSREEVRREDDEILRQLQSTQARISIWSLPLLLQRGLIHMMTTNRATCIVFSVDDLPPEGSDHTHPLYILVVCSGHKVLFVLLDNGSALNVCPLATVVALDFAPSDFGFTFDEVQTLEIQDFCRDFVAMSFDQHSSTLVLDMMKCVSFYRFWLERRQHGSNEFVTTIDHDTHFELGFTILEDDVHFMA
ncbi:hypothetical protein AAG906_019171 [Vitis piasezkii]